MDSIKKIIDTTKKKLKQDHDCVIAIVGAEGSGKSHLMLNMLDYYNPNAEIDDIALNQKDFQNAIQRQKRFGCPVFDEAGDGLYSRDAMTSFNKKLIKLYMAIRGKNLFTILVLPDFFDLDTFFRRHRIKGLFQVYKRGRVKFWDKKQISYINMYDSKSRQITTRPLIYDTFPIYKGHLAEEYKKRKDEKIEQALNDINKIDNSIKHYTKQKQIQILKNDFNLTAVQIINLGYSSTSVYRVINNIN